MTPSYAPPDRETHERWLLDLTALPTAAGREHRVCDWVSRWIDDRPDLALRSDEAGNMIVERLQSDETARPLFITAHLDHPAFVVESMVGPATLNLAFRGGVRDPYFNDAPIHVITADDRVVEARVVEAGKPDPFRRCIAELTEADADAADLGIAVGDIARWALPDPQIIDGEIHTHACDDLAALTAALAAFDALRSDPEAAHVRLLFTRAEEVGFIGAIAAMKAGTVPANARLVLLENSRAFPESPIGGGPIVRVGDRMSTFSPTLTAAFARVAQDLEKETGGAGDPFRWQRKLMPGGACEATVYQAFGYEATCLCLPLGNYHNMANLQAVMDADPAAVASARCEREHVSLDDFHNLVRLLIAAGTRLADAPPLLDRLEKIYSEGRVVLED